MPSQVWAQLNPEARKALGSKPAWFVFSELADRYHDALDNHRERLQKLAAEYDLSNRALDDLVLNFLMPTNADSPGYYQRINRVMNSFVEANPMLDLSNVRQLPPLVVAEALFRWLSPDFAAPDWNPHQAQ
jgi:hypothetical protein